MNSDQIRRNFILLAISVFALSFTLTGIHVPIFNNYAVERLGIEAHQLGIVEAIREVPGLLAAFLAGLIISFAEPLIAGIFLMIYGFGLFSYAHVYTVESLVIFSFIWSIGFHLWMPLSDSMALSLTEERERGKRLGQLRSVAGLATLAGIVLTYIIKLFGYGYTEMYWTAGIVGVAGAFALFAMSKDTGNPTTVHLVFKRKYSLFYFLTFLSGYRRQIFMTFALFALVKIYNVQLCNILILSLINSGLNVLLAPQAGKLVDKMGERVALSISYGGLIIVFSGYALIHNVYLLFLLYITDNLLFLLSMAITTYIGRTASSEDIKPTLAMGVTMNHIAAVIMPLVGGFIWISLGYEVVFFLGAGVAVMSFIASQKIKPKDAPALSPVAPSDAEYTKFPEG